jgi:two-component system OmpR family sensor kinase
MLVTFHGKLAAVLIGFALVMALMFLMVARELDLARGQEVNQRLYRSLASQLVSERILPESHTVDLNTAREVFDRLRIFNPRIDVYLLDGNGKILASSSKTRNQRQSVDLEPIRSFLGENARLPILGDDPAEESGKRVFSVASLSSEPSTGYLYLVLRGVSGDSLADRIRNSYALRESIWLIASGLVLAFLASLLIVRLITRPLRRLTAVMDRFRQSGFAAQPEQAHCRAEAVGDEIDKLTSNFNQMADRILGQMDQLKEDDRIRRELVANISHDLRTPLASLQGYLETLAVKDGQLTAEEKKDYLDIALKQSAQLGKLVSELFELAKLDFEPTIRPEPFVLEDLVQDVMQQFELAAAARQITLAINSPADLPLAVAEIGLIERALKNLIENSLRYTPSGGTISVSLVPAEGHITVQVSDTGCGIKPHDLPKIFDRFYRSEKSRGDSSGNAGLGLAITKRIIEMHDSSIAVTSEPGATTFSFTLPYAGTAATG